MSVPNCGLFLLAALGLSVCEARGEFVFEAIPLAGALEFDPESGIGSLEVLCQVTEEPGHLLFPRDTDGFSLGLAHDPALLEVETALPAGVISSLEGGFDPDFLEFSIDGDGLTCGCVYPFFSLSPLSFEDSEGAVRVVYRTVAAAILGSTATSTTVLEWRDDLGLPPVWNLVVVAGTDVFPETIDTVLNLRPGSVPFVRGDCNGHRVLSRSSVIAPHSRSYPGTSDSPSAASSTRSRVTARRSTPVWSPRSSCGARGDPLSATSA